MIFDRHLVYRSEGSIPSCLLIGQSTYLASIKRINLLCVICPFTRNIRVDIIKKVCFNPLKTFLERNLFNLSTHTKNTFEPLKSKIHLLVFTVYERGVAGHKPFQNLKISTSTHFKRNSQIVLNITCHWSILCQRDNRTLMLFDTRYV